MAVIRYPMDVAPAGWYRVLDIDDLAVGEVKALHYFERDLVAFRDAEGAARVFDRHCPHFGADLSVGGRVENGELICPFHSFRYDGTGACVAIPYTDRI